MSLGQTDADIDFLFSVACDNTNLSMDVNAFMAEYQKAYYRKAPPSISKQAQQPGSKIQSKIGPLGARDAGSSEHFDSWELEKKF